MISDLTDEEILDFLMTSEFEGDYKPEELKYLLFKWRYFYRIISGRFDLLKTDSSFELAQSREKIKFLEKEIQGLLIMLTEANEKIDSIKNRNLTLSERIKGKINLD